VVPKIDRSTLRYPLRFGAETKRPRDKGKR
jgi:hypothetical protein